MGKKRKKIWTAAPSCIFWALWCARNKLAFENEAITAQRIKINILIYGLGLTCLAMLTKTLS